MGSQKKMSVIYMRHM